MNKKTTSAKVLIILTLINTICGQAVDVNGPFVQISIDQNLISTKNKTGTYINVYENLNRNHIIAYINLNDPDNDQILHDLDMQVLHVGLTDELKSKYVQINRPIQSVTSVNKIPIRLNRIKDNFYVLQLNDTLNFELANIYEFLLIVNDAQISLKMFLLIQPVHKRPPRCDRDTLKVDISEDCKPNTKLADIHCVDFQTEFSLKLVSNVNMFAVNSKNELVLIDTLYDKADTTYELMLEAVNTFGLKSQMKILVTVADVNNNRPEFNRNSYRFHLDSNAIILKNFAFFTITDKDTYNTNSKHFDRNKAGRQFEFKDELCEKSLNFQYNGNFDGEIKFQIRKLTTNQRANGVQCLVELLMMKHFNSLHFNLTVGDFGDGLLASQAEFYLTMEPNSTSSIIETQKYIKNQTNLIDLTNNLFKLFNTNVDIKLNVVDIMSPTSNNYDQICLRRSADKLDEFRLNSCSTDQLKSVYYANMELYDSATFKSYFKQYFIVTSQANQSEQISLINNYIDIASGLHDLKITKLFFNKNSSFVQFLVILSFLILSAFLFLVCCICLIIRNAKKSKSKQQTKAGNTQQPDHGSHLASESVPQFKQYVYCLSKSNSNPLPCSDIHHDKVHSYLTENIKLDYDFMQTIENETKRQVLTCQSSSTSTSTDEGCFGSSEFSSDREFKKPVDVQDGQNSNRFFIKNFSRFEQIYNSSLNDDIRSSSGSYV